MTVVLACPQAARTILMYWSVSLPFLPSLSAGHSFMCRIWVMWIVKNCSGTADATNQDYCMYQLFNMLFRFLRDDLERLAIALNLPEKYICSQGTIATGMEALLILLRRLSYPNRWCDLIPLFGRSESELSIIFRKVCQQVNRALPLLSQITH